MFREGQEGQTMSKKTNTIEYRWQAYLPDTNVVAKQGPIRTDLSKVEKYVDEIRTGITNMDNGTIIDGWSPAPYWSGLKIRIMRREITPWTELQ